MVACGKVHTRCADVLFMHEKSALLAHWPKFYFFKWILLMPFFYEMYHLVASLAGVMSNLALLDSARQRQAFEMSEIFFSINL